MKKTAYLRYHDVQKNIYRCDVVELGTDKVLKSFRSAHLIPAEDRADRYSRARYVVVDYNPKTKKVSGTVDVTLADILKNSEESFPLYLARKLAGKFMFNLSDIRYSIGEIGVTGKTIGIEVEAKLVNRKPDANRRRKP